MLKKLLLTLILIIISIASFSSLVSADVVINEVLPNPEEEGNAEWVELFSLETLNLSGWKLNTTGQILTFGNVIISDYLIIISYLAHLILG